MTSRLNCRNITIKYQNNLYQFKFNGKESVNALAKKNEK